MDTAASLRSFSDIPSSFAQILTRRTDQAESVAVTLLKTSAAVSLFVFWTTSILAITLLASWIPQNRQNRQNLPPKVSPDLDSLAPRVSINAIRSQTTWSVDYGDTNDSTNSTLVSHGRFHIESWSDTSNGEISINVWSPCDIYSVALHVSPDCQGEGAGSECQAIFSRMQVLNNLTNCAGDSDGLSDLTRFDLTIRRTGCSNTLDHKGFNNGTEFVSEPKVS